MHGMPQATTRATQCADCATRGVCVLGRLPPDDLQLFSGIVSKRHMRPGERLTDEGRLSSSVLIVKMGNVFGYRRGLDGRDRPIGIAGRGALFGLFGYFDQPNQVTTIAASSGRVCEMPFPALRQAVERYPPLLGELVRLCASTAGAIASWSEAMRLPGVVNQLAYMVVLLSDAQRTPVVELPTHTALAELLGANRETVARALARLEQEGGIRRAERKKCEVRRQVLLARVSAQARSPVATAG